MTMRNAEVGAMLERPNEGYWNFMWWQIFKEICDFVKDSFCRI